MENSKEVHKYNIHILAFNFSCFILNSVKTTINAVELYFFRCEIKLSHCYVTCFLLLILLHHFIGEIHNKMILYGF